MKSWKMVLMVTLGVALCGAAFALSPGANASVTSEPLTCFANTDQVVCFDGEPAGKLSCERLDNMTVICSAGGRDAKV